ncbi:TPA: hypothetical protein EYP12_00850 [Candidatus Bipolaricaulota bacterium]|nr:hypothetical protein [Candidatus Bipolaricaulota bacterium]
MKMIAAMVQDEDADELLGALMEEGFRATRVSASGAFLRRSNAMILIGVEEGKVERALGIIKTHCHTRTVRVNPLEAPYLSEPVEVEIGGAVVFIWDIERYERF